MKKKFYLFSLLAGIMFGMVGFTSCCSTDDDVMPPVPAPVAVTGITLDQTELVIAVGDAPVQLVATVSPDNATDKTVTWTSSDPEVATVANGMVTPVSPGTAIITAKAGDKDATCAVTVNYGKFVDLSTLTADFVAKDGVVLTGVLGGNYKISIADGATVTLDGVTINGVNSSDCKWAGINCPGDATIILKDGKENTVKGFYTDYPGLWIAPGKTLTIKGETEGTGTLDASSNGQGAGIGAGLGGINCGDIIIEGGNITATGGKWAAGIGGTVDADSQTASCGNITITGGTITATGGETGAAIGSGCIGTCGDITIANTVTKVIATKGVGGGDCIGAGYSGKCGTVKVGGVTGIITTSPYIYPEM